MSTDTAAAAPAPALVDLVVAATMRHTGYQRHHLDLDADLESGLGIDSVAIMSIVADLMGVLGVAGGAPVTTAATTLRALVAELTPYHANGDRADPTTPPDVAGWDGASMREFADRRDPDLFAKAREFVAHLRRREEQRLYWYGMALRSRVGGRVVVDDEHAGRERELLMFASNDYLGLANHPDVVDAICDAARTHGATHTGSRIIGGTSILHRELERRLAAFKGRPACIVYPGGYAANLGAVSALVRGYDTVVADRLNHMSIVDGAALSGGVRRVFGHNDMADLERVLQHCDPEAGRLIAVDGVFSMHGDVCNLPEIARLAREYGARVLVDDAHATGVLGARGTGTAEHFGLSGGVDLELGTMSKALAGMGGFVVGDGDVIEFLRFYSHSYVFAATIPAPVAAGLIAALDVIEAEPERIATLWANIRLLRRQLVDAGFDLGDSASAILPVVVGDERTALEMGRAVRARGLFCQTVVYPGVALGDARLRVSVSCEHTTDDLELAARILVEAGVEAGVLPAGGAR